MQSVDYCTERLSSQHYQIDIFWQLWGAASLVMKDVYAYDKPGHICTPESLKYSYALQNFTEIVECS